MNPLERSTLEARLGHGLDLTPREAVQHQRDIAHRVRIKPLSNPIQTIAGVDVSIRKGMAHAAIVVMSLPEMEIVDHATFSDEVRFPYVPGLLSFRELPAILPALDGLSLSPDVFMLDAQGLAHPRRLGLACHLGVVLDRQAFGVAKSRLHGEHQEPGTERGSVSDLLDGEEVIGRVVRTRAAVKPVFVSAGHRITLGESVELTLASTTRYRLPEPTRLAHHLGKRDILLQPAPKRTGARLPGGKRPSP